MTEPAAACRSGFKLQSTNAEVEERVAQRWKSSMSWHTIEIEIRFADRTSLSLDQGASGPGLFVIHSGGNWEGK